LHNPTIQTKTRPQHESLLLLLLLLLLPPRPASLLLLLLLLLLLSPCEHRPSAVASRQTASAAAA
jgi:hypothetical protein